MKPSKSNVFYLYVFSSLVVCSGDIYVYFCQPFQVFAFDIWFEIFIFIYFLIILFIYFSICIYNCNVFIIFRSFHSSVRWEENSLIGTSGPLFLPYTPFYIIFKNTNWNFTILFFITYHLNNLFIKFISLDFYFFLCKFFNNIWQTNIRLNLK